MPFRERVKRAFGRGSGADADSLSKTSSRKSSNVYQPGEPMPKPKYRQPVDKKHKERLEAFSFGDNQRRKSIQSIYSPMGSKWPSRNSSVDHGWMGYGRRHPPPGVLTDLQTSDDYSDASGRKDSSDSKSTPEHLEHVASSTVRSPVSFETAPDHNPFSVEDLHQALERSTSRGQGRMVTVT